jgi:hypothetical protein
VLLGRDGGGWWFGYGFVWVGLRACMHAGLGCMILYLGWME